MLRSKLLLGILTSSASALGVLLSTAALARPPQGPGDGGAPLVGRVLTRAGIVDLTRETLAEGGPAHELVRGLAGVMADAEVVRHERAAPTPSHAQHAK